MITTRQEVGKSRQERGGQGAGCHEVEERFGQPIGGVEGVQFGIGPEGARDQHRADQSGHAGKSEADHDRARRADDLAIGRRAGLVHRIGLYRMYSLKKSPPRSPEWYLWGRGSGLKRQRYRSSSRR
jgi:hypothetical protein